MASEDLQTRVFKKFDNAMPEWTHALTILSALRKTGTGGTTAREKYTFPFPLTNVVAVRVDATNIDAIGGASLPGGVFACADGVLDAVDVDIDAVSEAGVYHICDIPAIAGNLGAVLAGAANPAPELTVFPSPFTVGTGNVDIFLITDNASTTGTLDCKITIYMNDPSYTYPAMNIALFASLADL